MWIVDAGVVDKVKGNQIFKYSPAGELLLMLGKPGVRGNTPSLHPRRMKEAHMRYLKYVRP
jgi:hypothetical protein